MTTVVAARRDRLKALSVLLVSSCSLLFDEVSYRGIESSTGDAAVSDAGRQDAGLQDASLPDSSMPAIDGSVVASDSGTCSSNLQSDPLNCGRCARSCLGGQCQAGACRPVTLATLPMDPWYLSGDGQYLYVTARSAPPAPGMFPILKVQKSSGAVSPLGLERGSFDTQNSTDHLYWTNDEPPGSLRRALKSGVGQPETVAELPAGQKALDFALVGDATAFVTTLTKVFKIDIATKKVEPIGDFPTAEGIDVNNGRVYFSGTDGGTALVYELDVATSAFKPLAQLSFAPRRLVASKDFVFVVGYKSGVARVARATGNVETIIRSQNPGRGFQGLAFDADFFYWSSGDSVFRSPLNNFSKTFEVLSNTEQDPLDLYVDDQALYWVNRSSGEVRKLAK